jgi:hypothetical protein
MGEPMIHIFILCIIITQTHKMPPPPPPSVSFSFDRENDGNYMLNVIFENVDAKYRFFVINYFARSNEKKGVQELLKNNSYKHGAHVMVAGGPHTFYLLCGPGLEDKSVNDVTTLDALLTECRNPENDCKVVQENVYVFDTHILTGDQFEILYQDGGRKPRKHRKSRNRKHCNRKSRKHCNRKSRRR